MDLDSFLAAQGEMGEWDSRAGFTIAVEKARESLARYALASPGFYLVKMVQAAVALGATRMQVRTSRREVYLGFNAPRESSMEELLEVLSDPSRLASEGVRLLAHGFAASDGGRATRASLCHWFEAEGQGIFVSEKGLAIGPAPRRPFRAGDEPSLWVFRVKKQGGAMMESLVESERRALRRRCHHLPIAFQIEGKPLVARPYPRHRAGWLDEFSQPFWLVERHLTEPGGGMVVGRPMQVGLSAGQSGWLRTLPSPTTFCLQPLSDELGANGGAARNNRCRAAYFLPASLDGHDVIAFLRHGVVADTAIVCKNGAGALALIDDSRITFDVSGFAVVRDAEFETVMSETRLVWSQMAQELRPDLERLTGLPTINNDAQSCGSLSACGCLGSVMLLSGPVGILLSLLEGLGYLATQRQGSGQEKPIFRIATEARLVALVQQGWPGEG